MISELDSAVKSMLEDKSEPNSMLEQVNISFECPNSTWREGLEVATLNCYLYDVTEDRELQTSAEVVQKSPTMETAGRRRPPKQIAFSYCLTAWSAAETLVPGEIIREEHQLLGEVLMLLLKTHTIAKKYLEPESGMDNWWMQSPRIPPHTMVAISTGEMKNLSEFWGSLNQPLKPSLNYVVSLAFWQDEEEPVAQPLAQLDRIDIIPQDDP